MNSFLFQASLVGHMNCMHFLDGATTYVEFGAGRGFKTFPLKNCGFP